MRVLRNRVVEEWNDRLADVPTQRDDLPQIGETTFLGQRVPMRKFNVLLPVPQTVGDWEEMPFLAGQGVSLVRAVEPAQTIVERMMADAATVIARLSASKGAAHATS